MCGGGGVCDREVGGEREKGDREKGQEGRRHVSRALERERACSRV